MPDPNTPNPLSRPVGPIASDALSELAFEHALPERCGGPRHLGPARARLERQDPNLVTHADDNALPDAADAIARAIHFVERSRQEHNDAHCSEIALVRARVLLVEALLLLECATHVNYNADRIAKAREAATNTPASMLLAPPG